MFSLEKPTPSAEMIYSSELIKSTFMELGNNDDALAEELAFYWGCLAVGAISITIQLPPHSDL